MSNYFTVEDEQQKMFTQLPKALLYEDSYKKMSNDAKVLYSFLMDRVTNSIKNRWIDANNQVYIRCSEIAMGEILNKSEKTVRKFKNELIDKGLLESANDAEDKTKWYVKKPIVTVEKLEQYIDGFNEVVKEKRNKERERNKEYRLKVAKGKVTKLKQELSNGKNDRSIENTGFQDEESLKPLQTLATVEITDRDQSKLPFSNNDFSNTDFLGMYVSTHVREEELETPFIQLAKDNNITFSSEIKEMIMSYEQVFSYEVYEYIFFEILNKFRNGRVNNFEKYLLSALDTQSSRGNFTLSDYVAYKADFNNKNYKRNDYKKPKSHVEPEVNEIPEVKEPEEPKFVPNFEPSFEETPTPLEDVPTVSEVDDLSDTPINRLKYRQKHGLSGVKYLNHSMKQLQEVVADIEKRKSMIEELMETYNKTMFDEETRRRFAIQELNLEDFLN